MDIIKTYFEYISKIDNVDKYKIITIDRKDNELFLITDSKSILTSQSLLKLLKICKMDNSNIFSIILNNSGAELNERFNKIMIESNILYENKLFYDFDPYSNFLLSEQSNFNDIYHIIKKIKTYFSLQLHNKNRPVIYHDYSKYVNPYGLEKVVFTGGGTKGVIYVGALIGLFTTGQLYYINHYAGTSIGALTAMVLGCITPRYEEYKNIRSMTLKNISMNENKLTSRYQESIKLVINMFYGRTVDTFYNAPKYTFYGIWTALDTIMKDNGLYDPVKSGFQIWYALICKKICQIMGNDLDKLIVIEKKDGTNVVFGNDSDNYLGGIDFLNENFEDWKINNFFSFKEYNLYTGKTLVLTGTKTSKIETVYYTHTNEEYLDLSVIIGATASMSIPWVFKAPIINGSYNLDGGLFDNYPLTHCDIKMKDKIIKYNNKIFGYLIDDKNTIIDAYELIREFWIAYNGFIDIKQIEYLCYCPEYINISQLFFEIRLELYKLLYYTDNDLETFMNTQPYSEEVKGFNIKELKNILDILHIHNEQQFNIPKLGISKFIQLLYKLDTKHESDLIYYKIGKKTDLSDVLVLSIRQGTVYNELKQIIMDELKIIGNMISKNETVIRYENILNHITQYILSYYELKGNFVQGNNIDNISVYTLNIMNNLNTKIMEINRLINCSIVYMSKQKKEDIKNNNNSSIQLLLTTISKIFTRSSNNEVDIDNKHNIHKSTYRKAIDYFFNTDMTGIIYKYTCIANDRICNDSINKMRTIKLNTFETQTLHFNMDDELISRLIYEGYSKTIKYFTNILRIMEITGKTRPITDEYLDSYELRFKKLF